MYKKNFFAQLVAMLPHASSDSTNEIVDLCDAAKRSLFGQG